MQALQALTERVSVARLTGPAPDARQCEIMLRAALRAADHGNLQPWRFLVIQDAGLDALGELFCRAALTEKPGLSEPHQAKYRAMPARAPMIIAVIAKVQEHPKVPASEQLLSAGAAAQNIINAAFALGLGTIWRTGEMAYHPLVHQGLGLAANEQLVGFLYLGQPAGTLPAPKTLAVEDFYQNWP
ncbi:MAG TPA: nitroreductase family protein [Cellvibrionaceae bacterium]